MVTVESGSTLPLLSDTVPVMPPRVCCASAHRESCKNTAAKEMPSFIFVAVSLVAINLVAINVNLVKGRNRNPMRPAPAAAADRNWTIGTFYGVAGELVGSAFAPCCAPHFFCTVKAGKLFRQMYANSRESESQRPVKILLTRITNFYGWFLWPVVMAWTAR